MDKDTLKGLSIDDIGKGHDSDLLLSGSSNYLLKPHTPDILKSESPQTTPNPQPQAQTAISDIVHDAPSTQSKPDDSFDLAALKLDSIVAEPDFGRGPVIGPSTSSTPEVSASAEAAEIAGLPADNLQLDRRPGPSSAPIQNTVSHPSPLAVRSHNPAESKDVTDSGGLRHHIKLIVLAVIILMIAGFVGHFFYHRYKITQKHDLPMADYDFELSYLENFGALPMQGNPNALVTLSIFCDFQCPYCPKIGDEVDDLLRDYDGDLRVVWVNFPLPFHPWAFPAAHMATVAYSQGKYWEMKDELYEHQKEMMMNPNYFTEAAERVGLDIDDMNSVLENPDLIDELNDAINTGKYLGVGGTPAMVINKYVLPPNNKKAARELIDYELERARILAKETGYRGGDELFRELINTAPEVVQVGNYIYNFGKLWETTSNRLNR